MADSDRDRDSDMSVILCKPCAWKEYLLQGHEVTSAGMNPISHLEFPLPALCACWHIMRHPPSACAKKGENRTCTGIHILCLASADFPSQAVHKFIQVLQITLCESVLQSVAVVYGQRTVYYKFSNSSSFLVVNINVKRLLLCIIYVCMSRLYILSIFGSQLLN